MEKLALEPNRSQENGRQSISPPLESFEHFDPLVLAPAERRLLLDAGLRYHLRRISHNYPVTAGDLLALLPFTSRQDSEELEAA